VPEGAPIDGAVGFSVCKCWVSFGNYFCNGIIGCTKRGCVNFENELVINW
jgi:hypothetical protein